MTTEKRVEIEIKIQEDKAKLNNLLSEQKIAQAKFREEKLAASASASSNAPLSAQSSATSQSKASAPPKSVPIAFEIFDIGAELQTPKVIIAVLKVSRIETLSEVFVLQKHGNLTDFKFTDLERKQALVRFSVPSQTASAQQLLEALANEGAASNASPDASFRVKLKEDESVPSGQSQGGHRQQTSNLERTQSTGGPVKA